MKAKEPAKAEAAVAEKPAVMSGEEAKSNGAPSKKAATPVIRDPNKKVSGVQRGLELLAEADMSENLQGQSASSASSSASSASSLVPAWKGPVVQR